MDISDVPSCQGVSACSVSVFLKVMCDQVKMHGYVIVFSHWCIHCSCHLRPFVIIPMYHNMLVLWQPCHYIVTIVVIKNGHKFIANKPAGGLKVIKSQITIQIKKFVLNISYNSKGLMSITNNLCDLCHISWTVRWLYLTHNRMSYYIISHPCNSPLSVLSYHTTVCYSATALL